MAKAALTQSVIKAFSLVARPLIRLWFPERNSCIAACRATIEVLELFDIQAWPISVRMKAAVKEPMVACGLGLLPEEVAKAERNPKHRRFTARGGGWAGHLIVGTEHNWLIDPTFDTAFAAFRKLGYDCGTRDYILAIETGKEVDPLGFELDATFTLSDGNTLELLYLTSPDEDYRKAPAWETDHLQLLIRQMVEAIIRMPPVASSADTPVDPGAGNLALDRHPE